MGLIDLAEFIRNTGAGPRGPRLKAIDAGLAAYHKADNHKDRFHALFELDQALEIFKAAKEEKHGANGYKASKREGGAEQNITKLNAQVDRESVIAAQCILDLRTAVVVCERLTDVKIADVDFSPAVTDAANRKMLPNGRTLYDTVRKDFDTVGGKAVEKVGGKWPEVQGLTRIDQRNDPDQVQPRQTEAFIAHEKAMTAAKLRAGGPLTLEGLRPIAESVINSRFAVCESIAATVIQQCKAADFQGPLEWIGIPYGPKVGHSIVVAYREHGDLNDLSTWGEHWFIIDMWYYNLGLRYEQYLFAEDADRYPFFNEQIYPFRGRAGGLKIMARAGGERGYLV